MKRTWKQLVSAVVAAVMILTGIPFTQGIQAQAAPASQGIGASYHTQEEIMAYLAEQAALLTDPVTYKVQPSYQAPYALGEISDESLSTALAMFNQVRYIAGLTPVTLDASYNELAQASSVVNAANNKLTHYPTQPAGMPDEMYRLGANGSSSSNIAMGYENLNKGIVRGWMEDGDPGNIDRLGHRRWILNPGMKKTGFGMAGRYSAMYAFDGAFDAKIKGVIWPAQEMPVEYFGSIYPWSYSYGSKLDASKIQVTMTRVSDNAVWNFSAASADGYFNVENSNYGQPGCVIFRPENLSYAAGDVFHVTISGAPVPVDYTVRFFSIGQYGHEHSYDITTEWSSDNHEFTATAICECGDTATIPGEVTWKDADGDCTIRSWIDYSATFTWAGYKRTYGKSVYRGYSAHAYSEPEFIWDGTDSCSVSVHCTHDGCLAGQTVGCTVTEDVIPATPFAEGSKTAVAKAVIDGKEYVDSKVIETIAKIPWFKDVPADSWYAESVKEVYELGIMTGNSAGTLFTPDGVMTRGMVVNVLYRLDGSPSVSYKAGFKDVDAKKYYTASVNWAVQNGIAKGYSDNTFRPDAEITREQFVIILYYYAQYRGMNTNKSTDLSEYKDNARVHSYALAPVKWAVADGIMSGSSAKQLNPLQNVTRAQAARMLAEFYHIMQQEGK